MPEFLDKIKAGKFTLNGITVSTKIITNSSPDRLTSVTVSVISVKLISLGIQRCNCNQVFFALEKQLG